MKYLLTLSLLVNVWFQFQADIVWKYVEHTYCQETGLEGYSSGSYVIFGIPLFHISNNIKAQCNGNR